MKWYIAIIIMILGIMPILWVLHDYYYRDKTLSTPHSIIILAGMICLLIAILQPESLKLGDVELKNIKDKAVQAAELAEENARLAIEANAMSIWNRGRIGGIGDEGGQEKLATEILRQAYGDKTDKVKHFMQHKGLFQTPANQLKNVPDVKLNEDEWPEIYRLKQKNKVD